MTVIPGNFQDKYGQTALQIYVFHLSFPATPPMLNLAYSKIRTCPHLQRSTKQTKRLSALIRVYHNISSMAQIWVSPYKTTRVLSGTLESPVGHFPPHCWITWDVETRHFTTIHHLSKHLQATSWCWKVQPTVARHSGTPSENNLAHISPLYTGGTTLMDQKWGKPNYKQSPMWQSMGGVYHNNQNETSGFLQHMPIQVWISGGWSHHSPLCWSNPDSLRHGPPQKKDGSEDGKTMENHGPWRNPQWNVLKWCRRNNQFSCLQHVDIARFGVWLSLNCCC